MTTPQNASLEPDATTVEELLRLMDKSLRAIQLYLPNNPMYSQAIDNLRTGFAQAWAEMEEVSLKVKGSSGFEWEGVEIIPEKDKDDLMSWTLYKDGIRVLTFTPGVEEDEIVRFLAVVNKVKTLPADAEDDLLTLLWEEEFVNIQYMYIELGSDDMPALQSSANFGTSASPEAVRQRVQEDVEEGADEPERKLGIASIEEFDSTLYFLEEAEVKHFKEMLDHEYKQDLGANLSAMLFDILELHTYAKARERVVQIFENIIPYILGAGDFRTIAFLLRESRVVLDRAVDLKPEVRQGLEQFAVRLSQPEAMTQILQTLDEAHVHPTEEELGDLFKALQPEALNTVLAWLPRLHNETVKDLLERAVDPLAQYHPEAVGRALSSEELDVVLGAIRLVTRHSLHNLSGQLAPLVTHENLEVRLGLVEALAVLSTPTAMQNLRQLVDDRERDVRIGAVKVITEKRHGPAFQQIETAVQGEVLKSTDLGEKRVFFEAYGLLGGDKGIDFLSSLLVNKGLLKKKWDPETRACAATALGKAGTANARDVLDSVRSDKDPLVRTAVLKALREIK